jgi:hypothetical protein
LNRSRGRFPAAAAGAYLDQALADRRELSTSKRGSRRTKCFSQDHRRRRLNLTARLAGKINVASTERIIHYADGAGFDVP